MFQLKSTKQNLDKINLIDILSHIRVGKYPLEELGEVADELRPIMDSCDDILLYIFKYTQPAEGINCWCIFSSNNSALR